MIRLPLLALSLGLCAQNALAQQPGYGGAKGADLTLEALEPDGGAVRTGLAGEQPADIARYLMANGAGAGRMSPDGATIAFIRDLTGQPELWLVASEGGQPRQLTFGTGASGFAWVPDGSGLLYSADRDGNEQPGYFFISVDGLQERSVLPAAAGDFRIFGDFARDGRFTYASTARNGNDFDIYRADLSGRTQRVYEGRFGFAAPSLSPDGRHAVVTETVGEDGDNLHLLDLETGQLRSISEPRPRASHTLGGFVWELDGAGFLFAGNAGREWGALSRYDLASGTIEVLAEAAERDGAGADIGNVTLCGPGGRWLAWTEGRDGFSTLHLQDRQGGTTLPSPELPEGRYTLDCGTGEGSQRLAVSINGWRTPGDLWTIDLPAGASRQVFAGSLAGLDPARLVRPQVVHYPARDGVMLQGLLYTPPGLPAGSKPPVLFQVHGGPSGQSGPTFDAVAQYHVNRGVAVFAPNVRGSTGLGRTYSTLDDQEKRLDSVRDLVDLLAALDADGLVDGSRAAVAGGSYGGYMVNAVLAAYPGAFRAGASIYGVADWITALEVASPSLKASDRIEYGDIADPKWRAFYQENSPIRQADRIRVPVLYAHGVMDPRIDIAESETMVRALRANGIEAPFIRIPDEGHGWRKLANQLFYYRQEAEFMEQQLRIQRIP